MASINQSFAHVYSLADRDDQLSSSRRSITIRDEMIESCLNKLYAIPEDPSSYQAQSQKFVKSTVESECSLQPGLVSNSLCKGTSVVECSSKNRLLDDVTGSESGTISSHGYQGNESSRDCTINHDKVDQEVFLPNLECMSRREYEDALKWGCKEVSSLLKKRPRAPPAVHPDHPLNHLSELHDQLFKTDAVKLDANGRSKRKAGCEPNTAKKRKNDNVCVRHLTASKRLPANTFNVVTSVESDEVNVVAHTQWDVKPTSETLQKEVSDSVGKLRQNIKVTDSNHSKPKKCSNSEFVVDPNKGSLIPIDELLRLRVTHSVLLEKFPSYTSGTPSKVLYIKNLPRDVTREELVSIFGNFDRDTTRSTYRLLDGRMKGQAFVRHSSQDLATEALETCLGLELRGKIIVIQYGKIDSTS